MSIDFVVGYFCQYFAIPTLVVAWHAVASKWVIGERVVGVSPDPMDSRRIAFTLSSGVTGVAHISSSAVAIASVFVCPHAAEALLQAKREASEMNWKLLPASVRHDPRVSRSGAQEAAAAAAAGVAAMADEGRECEVVPSQWMLGGEALCGVDARAGNARLSLYPAASAFQGRPRHFLDEGRGRGAPAAVSLGAERRVTCLASHPTTDDLFCGTDDGAFTIASSGKGGD